MSNEAGLTIDSREFERAMQEFADGTGISAEEVLRENIRSVVSTVIR